MSFLMKNHFLNKKGRITTQPLWGEGEGDILHREKEEERNGNRSFTIIEMIIVIALIFILAGIAIPLGITYNEYKKEKETKLKLKYIAKGMYNYFYDTNLLPTNIDALYTNPGVEGWRGPYVDIPANQVRVDSWRQSFQYLTAATGPVAVIYSKGPDLTDDSSSGWVWPALQAFQFQDDDFGIYIGGGEVEFEKFIKTRERIRILIQALEEHFDKRCSETGYKNTNLFPTNLSDLYVTQITRDLMYDAWGAQFLYTQDCDAGSTLCDSVDPPFEARIYTTRQGNTFEEVALGYCGRVVSEGDYPTVTIQNTSGTTLCLYIAPSERVSSAISRHFTKSVRFHLLASVSNGSTNSINVPCYSGLIIRAGSPGCPSVLGDAPIAVGSIVRAMCTPQDVYLQCSAGPTCTFVEN